MIPAPTLRPLLDFEGERGPRWQDQAACRETPTSLWFPERGHNEAADLAKSVCAVCPVREPCLEVGLFEKYGIWGGLTEDQRSRLRRQRARTVLRLRRQMGRGGL